MEVTTPISWDHQIVNTFWRNTRAQHGHSSEVPGSSITWLKSLDYYTMKEQCLWEMYLCKHTTPVFLVITHGSFKKQPKLGCMPVLVEKYSSIESAKSRLKFLDTNSLKRCCMKIFISSMLNWRSSPSIFGLSVSVMGSKTFHELNNHKKFISKRLHK